MLVEIKDSTDKKFVGNLIEATLERITLPSGDILEITGRCHIGNGRWRLWNSNYVLEVQEV